MRHPIATVLLISSTLLGGCASMKGNPDELRAQQQEALARWHNCLDRVSDQASDEPVKVTSDMITSLCEGHRRDVLLTFPASMERQLDALLMERGLRVTAMRLYR